MSAVAGTIPAGLRGAFDACRAITRARARNFYYGLRLTPEPKRSALFAIYAWSRLGDDIADGASGGSALRADGLGRSALRADTVSVLEDRRHVASESRSTRSRAVRLDAFADATERTIAGEPPDEPVWRALADTLARYPVDPAWLRQMIDGFRADLEFEQPATPDHLAAYCDRVAGTVGRMCTAVWGVRPGVDFEEAMRFATIRGLAFQCTNILRDVAEDADEGRVYLDRATLDAMSMSAQRLLAWEDTAACRACVLAFAARASDAFAASEPLRTMIDPACRPVLDAMTRIYRGVLARIEAQPRLVTVVGGARLGAPAKIGIAARALVASKLCGRRA